MKRHCDMWNVVIAILWNDYHNISPYHHYTVTVTSNCYSYIICDIATSCNCFHLWRTTEENARRKHAKIKKSCWVGSTECSLWRATKSKHLRWKDANQCFLSKCVGFSSKADHITDQSSLHYGQRAMGALLLWISELYLPIQIYQMEI